MRNWTFFYSMLLVAALGSPSFSQQYPKATCLEAQQGPKKPEPGVAHPGVDQKRVNRAINAGIEFLKSAGSPGDANIKNADELILLTFAHAGVENTPKAKDLLEKILKAPLETTYNVALQAMVLEELDRVKYQLRIHQCAQFLVDNQCANGQWSYGTTTTYPQPVQAPVPTGRAKTSTSTAGGVRKSQEDPGARQKPKVVMYLGVKKNRDGPASGDRSNAQYAALGIRACHDAGIIIPKEVVEKARKHFLESQEDGDPRAAGVATGPGVGISRGWNYHGEGVKAVGSMTAGAVGAICIYDFILGNDFRKDRAVLDGLAWMANHFVLKANPYREQQWHYYYLYAIERAGMLFDTAFIGPHDWYREGANYILDDQAADGSWGGSGDISENKTWGTCFAILFLKQATRRLLDVATTDNKR